VNLLELFAGSRSLGKVSERMGLTVCSVDVNPFPGIDLVRDIEFLRPDELPFVPDVIWASPPCQSYSISALGHHRPHGKPMSDFAAKSDKLVKNTLALIEAFPDAVWYIENPRGLLRKMPFMHGIEKATVWYCKYGSTSAKPTDIWTNNLSSVWNPHRWTPRPICHNSNEHCHHDKQPAGYAAKIAAGAIGKGTQGAANAYERSKIPAELCYEVIGAALHTIASRSLVLTP
jgi:hypothetical protein